MLYQHSLRASGPDRAMPFREPTLDETLSDPIVQAVMRADGVDALELEAMLMSIVTHLAETRDIIAERRASSLGSPR
jgi:hypothetical protein